MFVDSENHHVHVADSAGNVEPVVGVVSDLPQRRLQIRICGVGDDYAVWIEVEAPLVGVFDELAADPFSRFRHVHVNDVLPSTTV